MDSMDRTVLETAIEWLAAGRRVRLVTVARTWGSSPRPCGAWAAIRDDGQIAGSVSGGCIEDDLIDRVRKGELGGTRPELAHYGVTHAEAARFGLPCGGSLQLVIEPAPALEHLQALCALLDRQRRTVRTLDLASGAASLDAAGAEDDFACDERQMRQVFGPRWRLLLIGAGQLSRYVAQMAVAADYQVFVCDPREEFIADGPLPHTTLLREMPDDAVLALKPDVHTAVVALTHDPKLDDLALLEALKSPAFYVAALGSRGNQRKRRERLALFDLSREEIARLHGPAGLWLGGRTPPEIAISILAEMTACKYGVPISQRRDEPTGGATWGG
ncbi:MAG: XdhC family protein [Rhodocyclaceae bacterium]|jgi:xanthine dehydrogenase accessory factor|nr:XdhC family protein [Rhodocyclaceae bacterium]